ncbi:hypothetical protein HDU67_003415 [Dinochytrium kinnereticum]|nr:hypothetical protein HDU67_003415 [Dinochytrium kinnereticum]
MGGLSSSRDDFPVWHKVVGISLAVGSAFLIGSSFVLKKRGLLDSNIADNKRPGQGHGYLKNPLWWTGLILMLIGELCNVAAYAFSPAILVTPLGAVSVVVSAIMSDFFLKEKLNFSAKIGCAQCILGAILLVVNAPVSNTTTTIQSFWNFALDPIFIAYFLVNAIGLAYLIFYAAPRWGERWPLIYISICSIIGSFVVVSMQGFGSAVVYGVANPEANQFKEWSMYPLLIFVILSGVMQINYLNKALNIFSTAIVTPVYYVFFTTATLLCSAILLRDFMFDSALAAVSALVGFLVIVGGVALLFAYSLQLARSNDLNLQARTSSLSSGGTTPRSNTARRNRSPNEDDVGAGGQSTHSANEMTPRTMSGQKPAATTEIAVKEDDLIVPILPPPPPPHTSVSMPNSQSDEEALQLASHVMPLNGAPSKWNAPKRKGSETSAAMLLDAAAPFGTSEEVLLDAEVKP